MMNPGKTIPALSAPVREPEKLKGYWSRFFEETPVCTHPGCREVAFEVDHMFPYLDDNNRCVSHTESAA